MSCSDKSVPDWSVETYSASLKEFRTVMDRTLLLIAYADQLTETEAMVLRQWQGFTELSGTHLLCNLKLHWRTLVPLESKRSPFQFGALSLQQAISVKA